MSTITKKTRKKVVSQLKDQTLNCGECAGFTSDILRDKKLCSKRDGVIAASKVCNKFIPDTVSALSLMEEETFIKIARLMKGIPDDKLRIVGALFMRERITRSANYFLGQKVYVRFRGQAKSNYLSNFMSAHVLYADENIIRVGSVDGKCSMTLEGSAKDAVFRYKEFQPLYDKMKARGRLVDPESQRLVSKRLRAIEEYELGLIDTGCLSEISTIDRVFKANKVKKTKAKSPETNDLVSIVRIIEQGHSVKARKKKPTKSKGTVVVDVSN